MGGRVAGRGLSGRGGVEAEAPSGLAPGDTARAAGSAIGEVDDLATTDDAALVLALARLDEAALAEVYRRHAPSCYGLARKVLGDAAIAEEVVQDVIVQLWSDPGRFDPERGSLRAFLLAQAHRRAVDRVRSESSRQAREARQARSAVSLDYDLEREVVAWSLAGEVRDALGGLPEAERRAIALAYLAGHTYREVAGLLDEPEGTVKSRIRSGLARLRGALGPQLSGGGES